MKKSKFFFLVFLFLFSILLVSKVYSVSPSGIAIQKGKNVITFNNTEPFYVGDLVKLNPEIEVVSFYVDNEAKGYINFLGGIGENFIVSPGETYEIFANENATLVFP